MFKPKNDLKEYEIINLDEEAIKYSQTPIGQSILKYNYGRPRKVEKAMPNDKVKCELCGIVFSRSNRSKHKKTKMHKVYENLNLKLMKALIK